MLNSFAPSTHIHVCTRNNNNKKYILATSTCNVKWLLLLMFFFLFFCCCISSLFYSNKKNGPFKQRLAHFKCGKPEYIVIYHTQSSGGVCCVWVKTRCYFDSRTDLPTLPASVMGDQWWAICGDFRLQRTNAAHANFESKFADPFQLIFVQIHSDFVITSFWRYVNSFGFGQNNLDATLQSYAQLSGSIQRAH